MNDYEFLYKINPSRILTLLLFGEEAAKALVSFSDLSPFFFDFSKSPIGRTATPPIGF